MRTIGMIIYLVVGVLVASANGYLGDVGSLGGLLNLLLAILLWPLVLLGVDFKLRFGGGGKNNSLGLLTAGPSLALRRLSVFGRSARSGVCDG